MIRFDTSISGHILVCDDDYVLFAIDALGDYTNSPESGGIYMWYMPEHKDIFDLSEETKSLKIVGVDVL